MIVIDASVWVSYFLNNDLNHTASISWLEPKITNNTPLIGPTFLLSEVTGPVTRRSGPAEARSAFNRLRSLSSLVLLDIDEALAGVAANLAIDLQLRGCDAVYVAVAEQLDLPLITWDREIISRSTTLIQAQTP